MKEFVDKLIRRFEEEPVLSINMGKDYLIIGNAIPKERAISIVNQLAEEYKISFMQELVEARKNCSEDSDCSQCLFGQIEDRCILAELQIDADIKKNNGWIPCSERLPDKYCHCLVTRRNDYEDGSFDSDVREDVYIELEGVWDWQSKFEGLIDNIIAWQPLPQAYQPKGE